MFYYIDMIVSSFSLCGINLLPVGGKTMLKLIKNIHVYSPEDMGVKDVLIAANKICRISDEIKIESNIEIEVIDGSENSD